MNENNNLNDVSGIGQIGCSLIERISELCGWLYNNNPKVMARNSFIEDVKKSNLPIDEKTILISNANRITKEYYNQKTILSVAVEHLKESSRPADVDITWISQFMDKARLVSTEQAQVIWGKLLAEECNNPNTVPKSLLFILEQMDGEDARAFTEVCSCSVCFSCKDDESYDPIIHDFGGGKYYKTNLKFGNLLRLENLGLIKQELGPLKTGFATELNNVPIVASYSDKQFSFPDSCTSVPVGRVIFTHSGSVLCRIIDAPVIEGFFEAQCIPYWEEWIKDEEKNNKLDK